MIDHATLETPSFMPPGARMQVDYEDEDSVRADVRLGRWRVGTITWTADGRLDDEQYCEPGGLRHGVERGWSAGRLAWCDVWHEGLRHGPSIVLDDAGRPISVTLFEHGTGVELWWEDGAVSAVRPRVDGELHGLFREGDPERPTSEETYAFGHEHGIARQWDDTGCLADDFPRFFVRGQRVTAEGYATARAGDPSLPAYRVEDDHQARTRLPCVEDARARAAEWAETFDCTSWLAAADAALAERWQSPDDDLEGAPVDPLTVARAARYQRPEWVPSGGEIVVTRRDDHFADGEVRLEGRTVARLSWTLTGWLSRAIYLDPEGRKHGVEREYRHAPWFDAGPAITWTHTWHHGVMHGLSLLLDPCGRPLTASLYDQGTGADVWGDPNGDEPDGICEVHQYADGQAHGPTRWGPTDRPYLEEVFVAGRPHGIWRRWSEDGALDEGFPQFFVDGEQVSRADYVAAAGDDPTLMPYQTADDAPERSPLPVVEEARARAAEMRPTFGLRRYIAAEDAQLAALWAAAPVGREEAIEDGDRGA